MDNYAPFKETNNDYVHYFLANRGRSRLLCTKIKIHEITNQNIHFFTGILNDDLLCHQKEIHLNAGRLEHTTDCC